MTTNEQIKATVAAIRQMEKGDAWLDNLGKSTAFTATHLHDLCDHIDELEARLAEAEGVISHYADSKHWTQSDFKCGNNYYLGEYDNGYDVADEYKAKHKPNP